MPGWGEKVVSWLSSDEECIVVPNNRKAGSGLHTALWNFDILSVDCDDENWAIIFGLGVINFVCVSNCL